MLADSIINKFKVEPDVSGLLKYTDLYFSKYGFKGRMNLQIYDDLDGESFKVFDYPTPSYIHTTLRIAASCKKELLNALFEEGFALYKRVDDPFKYVVSLHKENFLTYGLTTYQRIWDI